MFLEKAADQYSTIFVSVAAFNDRWIQQTIDTAISKADYPGRVYFGVWEHRSDFNFMLDSAGNPNIKHAKLHYPDVLGVGPARSNAFSLYNNEDFILQIDAHTIFNDHWDTILLDRYNEVSKETQNDKIIFSSFVPWWQPRDDGSKFFSVTGTKLSHIDIIRWDKQRPVESISYDNLEVLLQDDHSNGLFLCEDNNQYLAVVKFWKQNHRSVFNSKAEAVEWMQDMNLKEWEPVPQHYGSSVSLEQTGNKPYAEHTIVTAHFIFSIGDFVKDIAPDPNIMFMGEEHTTALRAWTRGYRIYGLQDILLWHLNKDRNHDPDDRISFIPKELHYRDHYTNKNRLSLDRTRKILTGELIGYWGSPNKKLLSDFEKASNFSFKEFYERVDKHEKE